MVDFCQVSVSQIQSTGRASPFLLLEECSQSRSGEWVIIGPFRPVYQVSVGGGRVSFHLHMPLNLRARMHVELRFFGSEFVVCFHSLPVPSMLPLRPFVRMSP